MTIDESREVFDFIVKSIYREQFPQIVCSIPKCTNCRPGFHLVHPTLMSPSGSINAATQAEIECVTISIMRMNGSRAVGNIEAE